MFPTTANEADVQALRERLEATPVGEVCTYAQLDAALGSPSRARRYLVLRALHRMNRETGAIFGAVRGVGYKRLAADEAYTLGHHGRGRIRRTARRTSAAIAQAVSAANEISDEAKRKAMAEVSTLNMIAHVATDRVVKAAQNASKPPTLAESLRGVMAHLGIEKGDGA